jgi:hypothetical protein
MKSAKSLVTVGILSALAFAGPMKSLAGAGQAAAAAKPGTEIPKVEVEIKDFSFSAHTPAGWREDKEAAKKYQVNLVFVPEAEEARAGGAVIQVSADHKFDENVSLRIQSQVEAFRSRYPRLEVADLDVKHPKYATYAKQLSQAGDFYQDVAYANPGSISPYVFYASLTTRKAPPTAAELAAFREVLESLEIGQPKEKPKGQG